MTCSRKCQKGFSIIELLVVCGMLSLVLTALYSIYLSHMKTAFSQEEAMDAQQSLQFGLEVISRDLLMAGALLPTGTSPIAPQTGTPPFPNYSTAIRMTTASADGRLARVTALAVKGSAAVTVEPPAADGEPAPVDAFTAGDTVSIIHPVDGTLSAAGSVNSVDRGGNRITLATGFANDIAAGDVIVKTFDTSPLPHTIDYYLIDGGGAPINGYSCPAKQKCLVRRVNGSNEEIIATHMTSLRFAYLGDHSEQAAPSDPAKVRAVRVTLQGGTQRTAHFSGKTRSRGLTSIIKLRNRR